MAARGPNTGAVGSTDVITVDGVVELVEGRPSILSGPHELAMVYGGGGVFGIAYGTGVAHGLVEAGIDVGAAPALGTSAGSWVASIMALGLPYEAIASIEVPTIPNARYGALLKPARELFGDARHEQVAVSAVCVRTRRRHILDGARFDLADLAAASSAVPALLPPHRVDGRLYVDGGMWSVTSIDAATDASRVIVVAPLAGTVVGPMGRTAGWLLDRELRTWRERHPDKEIVAIRPNREIAAVAGLNPMGLFDIERALAAYPLALEQGRRWGERLQEPLPLGATVV
ncbi:MAG: patatin-like phospholipase family protein [Microthrixaceae bacterium]